jgi:hypothetical protein
MGAPIDMIGKPRDSNGIILSNIIDILLTFLLYKARNIKDDGLASPWEWPKARRHMLG